MVTNFNVNGADIETLFEPIRGTTKRANVGYDSNSQDISNLFMDKSLQMGSDNAITTNYENISSDLSTLFAKKGHAPFNNLIASYSIGTYNLTVNGIFGASLGVNVFGLELVAGGGGGGSKGDGANAGQGTANGSSGINGSGGGGGTAEGVFNQWIGGAGGGSSIISVSVGVSLEVGALVIYKRIS